MLGAFLAGCANFGTASTASEQRRADGDRHFHAQTLFGNYLAGRVAGANRDTRQAARFYAEVLRLDPGNEVILDRAFVLNLADGDMKSATERARAIIAGDQDKRLAYIVLGLEAMREGRFAEARPLFDRAATGPFNSLAAHLLTAWSFVGEGSFDDAQTALNNIDDTATFSLFRLYHSALIADLGGTAALAEQRYRALFDAGAGDSPRVVEAYGRFLDRQNRPKDAMAVYNDFLASQPENPIIKAAKENLSGKSARLPLIADAREGAAEALYGLASALAQDRSIDLPIVYLQLALYLRPDFDLAQTLMADLFETTRRFADANALYGRVSRRSPLYENAVIQTAVNLDRMDRTDAAVTRLNSLARNKGGSLVALVSLGDVLRGRERYSEAADAYGRAIALVPNPEPHHWSLFYARGICYERAQRWPEAERDLLKALALDPEQPLVLNYLGYTWVEQGQRLGEALKMIERAVDLMPNDGYIVDSLGWAHFRLGNYGRAVEYLERAVSLRPEDPTINDHLGDAYWKTGRTLEARFQWRHAIALGAEPSVVEVLERKIEFGLDAAPNPPQVMGQSR